jgi:3-phenylpropionate/trans-cinnamate dioxygenase ferredoxin subunit
VAEARRVLLCAESEVELGAVRRFDVDGGPIALVHCTSGFRAVRDVCSHEDYPLSEGDVFAEECEIECLRHGSMFSLIDGEPQSLPATRPITVVPVEVDAEGVWAVLA